MASRTFSRSLLCCSIALASQAHVAVADTAAPEIEEMLIVGVRENRISTGATGLALEIKETPQSISMVSFEQMEQFGLNNLNDALRMATGIQVEEWETNRTNYTSRGFEIKNTQIDGLGMPNQWGIVTGSVETFGYDKIEIIRGANGLLTGVGNASGTLNFVRKRPTNETEGSIGASYGSWDTKRVEADYSTPFTADGTWAGRIVATHQDGDSYLRDKEDSRDFVYGVIDGQIGDNGTLTFGYSWQESKTDGNMWGALAFIYSDGTQAEWSRSASTTQDWAYWDVTTEMAFAEYAHQFSDDWRLKISYEFREDGSDSRLFYATDYLGTGIEPGTNLGLYGYPWGGQDEATSNLGAITIDGRFELFGREHDVMLGTSYAESEAQNEQFAADYPFDPALYGYIPMPGFPWAGDVVPEPVWGSASVYSTMNQRLKRGFGATRLTLTDRLKAIVGFNYAQYHRDGVNYGVAFDQTEENTSPYAGLTYEFTGQVLGYVSYSDIYQPQDQSDAGGYYLDPTKGVNYEIGTKIEWLDQRLLTTLAIFKAEQEGLATAAGYNQNNQLYYNGVDVESEGIEFEATGSITENVTLVFGYTALKLDGDDGDNTYRWVPRRTANLMLTARLPSYTAVSYGIGGRWQSSISNVESSGFTVRQESYAILNGFVAWEVLPNTTVQANLNNLTNEKYINTLRYSGYYGAGRNGSVSVSYKF